MSQNCYIALSNRLLSERKPRIVGRTIFDYNGLVIADDSLAYQCHTCGHFMHQMCGKSITSCPLCRQKCNVVLPVLFGDEYTPDIHLNVLSQIASATITSETDSMPFINMLADINYTFGNMGMPCDSEKQEENFGTIAMFYGKIAFQNLELFWQRYV